MEQILSKIDNKPLLSLMRYKDITDTRVDLSDERDLNIINIIVLKEKPILLKNHGFF